MNMNHLLEKKRNGEILTKEEIDFVIEGYTNDEIPDYQMSAMLMAIYFQDMNEEERANLTMAMVESGDTINLSDIDGIKVDKHSTGGVGDATPLKNIIDKIGFQYETNFYKWLNELTSFISNHFFDFIISKNKKVLNHDYFSKLTGLSKHTIKEYCINKRLPNYDNFNKLLQSANYTVEQYIKIIKVKGILCNEIILENVLNNRTRIRSDIKIMLQNN